MCEYKKENINTNTLAKTTEIFQESSYGYRSKILEATIHQPNYEHKYQQYQQTALFHSFLNISRCNIYWLLCYTY